MGLEVVKIGLLATIQDLGRRGTLALGATSGGAMDPFAHQLAQRLVNNPPNCAGIEIAYGGFHARAHTDLTVCITGAELEIQISDANADVPPWSVPMGSAVSLKRGQILELGRVKKGVYSYLAIAGGINTPRVLGSRSTVIREGLGGLNGQALAPGNRLPIGDPPQAIKPRPPVPTRLPGENLTLRYIAGFQSEDVDPKAVRDLEQQSFEVTGARDRMGARLSGHTINTQRNKMWSESTCQGAIQVPPDGQPIILLNDRQTMGGYPKLGAVIPADCARLAQAPNGAQVRFERVSPSEADRVLWLEHNFADELARALAPTGTHLL